MQGRFSHLDKTQELSEKITVEQPATPLIKAYRFQPHKRFSSLFSCLLIG